MLFYDWRGFAVKHEVYTYVTCNCRSSKDCADISRQRCHNCSCETMACGTSRNISLQLGIWKTPVLRNTLCRSVASIPLRSERKYIQKIVRHRCSFANGYDTNTLRINSFYTTVCGYTKSILWERVCSLSIIVTSGHGITFMTIREGVSTQLQSDMPVWYRRRYYRGPQCITWQVRRTRTL